MTTITFSMAVPPSRAGLTAHQPRFDDRAFLRSVLMSRLGNGSAEVLERDVVGLRPATHAGLERVDRGDLLACELEVEHVEVLGNAFGLDRLRDRRPAFLQVPAKHD